MSGLPCECLSELTPIFNGRPAYTISPALGSVSIESSKLVVKMDGNRSQPLQPNMYIFQKGDVYVVSDKPGEGVGSQKYCKNSHIVQKRVVIAAPPRPQPRVLEPFGQTWATRRGSSDLHKLCILTENTPKAILKMRAKATGSYRHGFAPILRIDRRKCELSSCWHT